MRRGAIAIFVMLLVGLASAVAAAPVTVGPLDGAAAPSLPAVAMPDTIATEKLASTAFPATLEQRGDYPSAILEWQRVAYQSMGADRLNALLRAAALQAKVGRDTAAIHTYQTIITEYPKAEQLPEIYYHLAQLTTGPARRAVLTTITTGYAQTAWGQAALMQDVWHQARSGRITQTYNLKPAETLQKRLTAQRLTAQSTAAIAGAFGVIPGAGHAYLGHWPQAFATFMAWALFMLAFLSACRHRHYAYAFVFVVPAAALWLAGPGAAIHAARQQARAQLHQRLAEWTDLAPHVPATPAPPPAPTLTDTLTTTQ